jgi:DNA sulfur modification protein DndB
LAAKQYPCLRLKQNNHSFILTRMKADHLTRIAYASVRGEVEEEGAVQRVLSPRRIAGVREFVLQGGDFPNCIVLNWVGQALKVNEGNISIPDEPRGAQIIDGQHRVAGLTEAIKQVTSIASLDIPVALYQNLNSQQCADIFLSINTEQKPVSRTLVFDLYGIASGHLIDRTALRAKDIATVMNETGESPYFGLIKFPGSPRMRGGIALSTVVSALKPIVDDKGPLELAGIKELERQTSVLLNLFSALREKYGEQWDSSENAFLYASGFMAALQFFRNKVIDYCKIQKSFKQSTISAAINLKSTKLIKQSEVRGQSGSAAVNMIYDRLIEVYLPSQEDDEEIEI